MQRGIETSEGWLYIAKDAEMDGHAAGWELGVRALQGCYMQLP